MNNDLRVLAIDEIGQRLKDFPGWNYHDDKISKEFVFGDFSEAVDFMEKLAPFCNKIDHHPDVHIYYKKIVFDLTRFSEGGKVTPRDFTVASEIEKLYSQRQQNDKS